MDFPIFHLDFLGNRLLIAIDAILHVLINHPFAVGGLPLVALLEWQGIKTQDKRWDVLAFRILKVFFIITTTVGATTGVGIWLSASLVNPASIGSLIRVFFWGWFTEWLVFITEVCLILWYFLSWEKMSSTPEGKRKHVKIGFFLAMFSWITMAIIVAILAFMMNPGNWLTNHSLLSGFFNPVYLPQLAFRTTLAMMLGGMVCSVLTGMFTKNDVEFRRTAFSFIARWILFWIPLATIAAAWYYNSVPKTLIVSMGVALATQAFSKWYTIFGWMIIVTLILVTGVAALAMARIRYLPTVVFVIPAFIAMTMFGQFERVREFIRKPFVINNYMYANGYRVEDYALLNRDGILKYATYTSVRNITPENQWQAGKEVFGLTCTRCHTVNGINGIRGKLHNLYGDADWSAIVIGGYLQNMHGARYYMPPFPGNAEELEALAVYLATLQKHHDSYQGAQNAGVPAPDNISSSTAIPLSTQSGAVQ